MTPQQIEAILLNCENIVRAIAELPEYKRLQQSQYFTTSNDLTLGDAIQALTEVRGTIATVQDWEFNNEPSL